MFASSSFGTPSTTPAFGTPPSNPAFGTSSSNPAFGATTSSTSLFGTPSSTPAFGMLATPSTPAFGTPSAPTFSGGSSLFSTPFSQPQQQTSLFQQPNNSGFGFQTPAAPSFSTPQQQTTSFPSAQLTTQMAPVAPLPFSLAERDIQAIVDAYKDEPGNPKYAFKHLLFSVTEPQLRVKPAGVADIMWAEALGKLEGMDSSNRERLWPQLVQGFKDLSQRLKLQDEVIVSDSERLKMTQSNVKMNIFLCPQLQSHFLADTLPRIERLRQKEQGLQRCLLRVMRIVEALEGKGCRLPLTKGEVELAQKLAAVTQQLKGSGAELSRRVQSLLAISRLQSNDNGLHTSFCVPGSNKIHEQSITDMQEVLQHQTEAIAKLGNVLKRDIRDLEIIMDEDTEIVDLVE
ncbi:hypothetical protein V2J09_015480 [Rumex salicifolius]